MTRGRSKGTPAQPALSARPPGTRLYVDAIEAGHARLLLGQEAFEVPASLLPPGTKEGSWLVASFVLAPAPPEEAEAEARRRRLGEGDDGGDIKL
jgi:hypothetical protein